jgi:cytidine deaminase
MASETPLSDAQVKLLATAGQAARLAYAPYSRFRVGAAVLAADGSVYNGVNVENASSPLGVCAEQAALAHAVSHGARDIVGVAVYCLDADPADVARTGGGAVLPCGSCRQWLAELAPDAWVVSNGLDRALSVAELLPMPFVLAE